jgi:chromosome segregation ATPase
MPPLEVSEVLRDLVIKMERMDSKLEQIVDKIDKLEKNVENINVAVSSQERRITILEQTVPSNIKEEITKLKTHQESQSKIMWAIGGATLAAWINMLFKLMG